MGYPREELGHYCKNDYQYAIIHQTGEYRMSRGPSFFFRFLESFEPFLMGINRLTSGDLSILDLPESLF